MQLAGWLLPIQGVTAITSHCQSWDVLAQRTGEVIWVSYHRNMTKSQSGLLLKCLLTPLMLPLKSVGADERACCVHTLGREKVLHFVGMNGTVHTQLVCPVGQHTPFHIVQSIGRIPCLLHAGCEMSLVYSEGVQFVAPAQSPSGLLTLGLGQTLTQVDGQPTCTVSKQSLAPPTFQPRLVSALPLMWKDQGLWKIEVWMASQNRCRALMTNSEQLQCLHLDCSLSQTSIICCVNN